MYYAWGECPTCPTPFCGSALQDMNSTPFVETVQAVSSSSHKHAYFQIQLSVNCQNIRKVNLMHDVKSETVSLLVQVKVDK
jgi:hypothetical protein